MSDFTPHPERGGETEWFDEPPRIDCTTVGAVTIDCPICTHRVTFPTTVTTIEYDDGGLGVRVELDMQAVQAHLLSHDQHDGEPLDQAA